MRYQRLILEAGANTVTVRFHPRLTVVTGMARAQRDGLIGELLGALGGGRRGAHLEVVDDQGRRLAIIRPINGEERVVESDTGTDVTAEFAGVDGRVDLLARAGLSPDAARRLSRLTADDVAVLSGSDRLVTQLAAADQAPLWEAAERLHETEARLKAEAQSVGAAPEDGPVVGQIERRHQEFEAAQRRHDDVRHHALFIGGACALGAVPAATMNRLYAAPFLVIAALTTLVSVLFRRRMAAAAQREHEALAEAGAQSYLGFQLQRVNGLLSTGHRQRLATAAEEHRQATDAWRTLAGDASVAWAAGARERIVSAAWRLRAEGAAGVVPTPAPIAQADPAELAHTLVARLADLRQACADGESLPLILDDPLSGVEQSLKRWMLELVERSAGTPQVVYLTEDEDVAAWARMEAVSGEVTVIEPSPDAGPGVPLQLSGGLT